ncbi:MAG: hypothetical protein WAX04_00205, partial [Oscillospiraceae bacterium]
NLILGAGFRLISQPLINVENGGRYIVTYKTQLPLQDGNYTVELQISTPIIPNFTASFLDVINDAIVFKMALREGGRLWAKAYVENQVEIINC